MGHYLPSTNCSWNTMSHQSIIINRSLLTPLDYWLVVITPVKIIPVRQPTSHFLNTKENKEWWNHKPATIVGHYTSQSTSWNTTTLVAGLAAFAGLALATPTCMARAIGFLKILGWLQFKRGDSWSMMLNHDNHGVMNNHGYWWHNIIIMLTHGQWCSIMLIINVQWGLIITVIMDNHVQWWLKLRIMDNHGKSKPMQWIKIIMVLCGQWWFIMITHG